MLNNKKQMTFKTFREYCRNKWTTMETPGGGFMVCGDDWPDKYITKNCCVKTESSSEACNIKNCQPWKGFRNVKN